MGWSYLYVGDAGNTSIVDAGTPLGDRGRYPKECWLSTLGVLHPGAFAMWYGHIRDLFHTAESCMGSRLPNATMLHWAQQKYALVGCDCCCLLLLCVGWLCVVAVLVGCVLLLCWLVVCCCVVDVVFLMLCCCCVVVLNGYLILKE